MPFILFVMSLLEKLKMAKTSSLNCENSWSSMMKVIGSSGKTTGGKTDVKVGQDDAYMDY